MGLDMYLNRRPKAMTMEEYNNESDRIWKEEGIDAWRDKFRNVHRVAYWRKVNWLHGYIVNTFAGGVDECQEIPLSKADMENILEKVKEACDLLDGKMLVPQKVIDEKDYRTAFADDDTKEKVCIAWDGGLKGADDDTYYKTEPSIWTKLDTILPPTTGFFFGSYAYDNWYAYDMFSTREVLSKIIAEWDDEQQYWYEASW